MTKAKKLFLHVGLPKSATSSLQRWFNMNRVPLHSAGIDYPAPYNQKSDKHDFLVPAFRSGQGFSAIHACLDASKQKNILFSNEGLSNHLYDFDARILHQFRTQTKEYNTTVILVTRPKQGWLRSYHKQCVINPQNGASDLWGTDLTLEQIEGHPRIKALLDHKQLETDLAAAFGAQSVVKVDFTDADWLSDIFEHLDIVGLGGLPIIKANMSLPDWAVESLRVLNQCTASSTKRLLWRSFIQEYCDSNHSILLDAADAMPKNKWRLEDFKALKHILADSQDQDVIDFMGFVGQRCT